MQPHSENLAALDQPGTPISVDDLFALYETHVDEPAELVLKDQLQPAIEGAQEPAVTGALLLSEILAAGDEVSAQPLSATVAAHEMSEVDVERSSALSRARNLVQNATDSTVGSIGAFSRNVKKMTTSTAAFSIYGLLGVATIVYAGVKSDEILDKVSAPLITDLAATTGADSNGKIIQMDEETSIVLDNVTEVTIDNANEYDSVYDALAATGLQDSVIEDYIDDITASERQRFREDDQYTVRVSHKIDSFDENGVPITALVITNMNGEPLVDTVDELEVLKDIETKNGVTPLTDESRTKN